MWRLFYRTLGEFSEDLYSNCFSLREAPIEQSVFSTTSFHCRSSEFSPAGAHNQAAVVQRLDSVLKWSKHYLVDTLMNLDNTNPLVNLSNLDSCIEQIEPRVYNSRTALMSQCFSDQSMTDKYAAIHPLSWAPASCKNIPRLHGSGSSVCQS